MNQILTSGNENKYIINKSSYLEKKNIQDRCQYYSMNLLFIYYIKNITTRIFSNVSLMISKKKKRKNNIIITNKN